MANKSQSLAPRKSAQKPKARTTSDSGRVRITPGTRKDIPDIRRLIRGLARYENLPAKATAATLYRHGFQRRPYFQTLIARKGDRTVGFALYFFTYSTFLAKPTLYIEDLFVLPDHRGSGTGAALMRSLARIALKKDCGRMEWAVLDWNKPAINFYRRIGAQFRKEWILTRLTGPALRKFAGGR